jgi:NADH:ubiquinone oxidoreductase subunit 5 (subunit L)/multisubunit Na+/H+ antiporter MnhA subunit
MIVLLIVSFVGISHVSMLFNVNIIIMMMTFVVSSIFIFVGYYIRGDVSNENFKVLKVLFLGLMVLMLVSYRMVIFIGWEGIGVISICLIRY